MFRMTVNGGGSLREGAVERNARLKERALHKRLCFARGYAFSFHRKRSPSLPEGGTMRSFAMLRMTMVSLRESDMLLRNVIFAYGE